MKRTACFLLLASAAAGLDKWTVDDVLAVPQATGVTISPDGRFVLYALTGAAPAENRQFSDLYVVSADGRTTTRLTRDDAREGQAEWLPDSLAVSFLAPDSRGTAQVWRAAVTGAAPQPVTRAERAVEQYAWSPDGTRLLYVMNEPKSSEQAAHEKEWGVVISPEEQWPARASLWVLETASGRASKVTDGRFAPGAPVWSPDGKRIAFLYHNAAAQPWQLYLADSGGDTRPATVTDTTPGVHSFAWSPNSRSIAYVAATPDPQPYENLFQRPVFQGVGSVWLYDVAAGTSRRLTAQDYPGLARVVWSRDSRRLAFLSRPPGTMGSRGSEDTLHILSLDGEVRTVAPGFDFYRGGHNLTWSADHREVWFFNGERMGSNVFAVDVSTGAVRAVTTGQNSITEVTWSRDFTSSAYLFENANTKPDIFVTRLPGWRGVKVTDLNPEVRRFALGRSEIIRYPSEGFEIEALLVKPPDFDPARKYPLLLIIHGGPAWYKKNDWRLHWEQHPIQVYAAEGYCLVFPNVRGSAEYGHQFRQANYGDLGGGDFRDAMAAVDYLIARGFIDENRLGVAGWSYGGFLTPAVITKTDRFKAAQFGAGIPSFEAMYSSLSTVEWIVHENYGSRPWEDPATHIRDSPLYAARNVKTPTLIEHGEDDPRCPVGGSILFYKALKFYGVPTVLEIYPKEGHGITGPLLRRRCMRRNLEWFNKWLNGDHTTSFEALFPSPK